MKHYGDSFGRLEDLSDATKYLASLLKSEFLVPNELELIDIQIVGQFSVYESGSDTDLKKQADQIREASIREMQRRWRPANRPQPTRSTGATGSDALPKPGTTGLVCEKITVY